ncbi:MAG: hypothetical protein WC732_05535 [Candidatus Omnitrophota bacterium]
MNYYRLRRFCRFLGADLFGVADVSDIKDEFEIAEEVKKGLNRAVCLGAGLSGSILSEITGKPTKLYFHHYRTANMFLDQMAFRVSRWLEARGAAALPIPASQILDWQKQTAHISHKKMGRLAGLGWLGRNNLLVSKKFGAQFRMATILTDYKLKTDRPLKEDCGLCRACLKSCPAGAIKETRERFGHLECFEKLKSFQQQNIVGQYVCGICVKVCGGDHAKKTISPYGLVKNQQGHHV